MNDHVLPKKFAADDIQIVFVLPSWNRFIYARRAAQSFFKYTEAKCGVIMVDDASPYWEKQDWKIWLEGLPEDRVMVHRFPSNNGLTRSWNYGLNAAQKCGAEYAIAGNSDILFTPGWEHGLIKQLNSGYHLVGPVTNAPGHTNQGRQQVANYYPKYRVRDDPEYLSKVADYLRQTYTVNRVIDSKINGFFLMSRTELWMAGKYDKTHVFNPANKMTKNEDELQGRWSRRKWRIGFVPGSFIFHYRAVSRGDRFKHHGWFRIDDVTKPV